MSGTPAPQDRPRRSYSELSEAQRWDWHARIYAHRRLFLEAPNEERTSPVDPKGEWFDEPRVDLETRRLIAKRDDAKRRRAAARDAEMIAGGRDICNRWARRNGFVDFPAAERAGYRHSDVTKAIFAAKAPPPVKGFGTLAGAMGVKAREFTPADMARGRAALGLQRDEAAREEPPH